MKETIQKEYLRWKTLADDQDVAAELQSMDGNEEQIEDAFYRNLAFGTGGLRGVIGAGTNRMNIYTVAKASQGLADYVNKQFAPNKRSIRSVMIRESDQTYLQELLQEFLRQMESNLIFIKNLCLRLVCPML